jgi:hypothetical protein
MAITSALTLLSAAGCSQRHTDFGEPMRADAERVPVSRVLENPEQYDGKVVLVSGVVDSVCAQKGCWLRVGEPDGKETLLVKFTCPVGDDRLIPMEAVGRRVEVQGALAMTEISEASRRHEAEDAGKSPAEIEAIVGPARELRFDSPAARVYGLEGEKTEG